MCDIVSAGAIVAHWLQLEGDHPSCADGQGICEGNHEIYLDGDVEPTIESLGVEDFYGHSTRKGKAPALQPFVDGASLKAPYRSCIYYYQRPGLRVR